MQAQRTRRRLSPEARKEEILDAALTAFSRGGYHGTQVSDVVREAGIARGTFYLYFESKHDVFAALVDRMLAIFLGARPARPEPDVQGVPEAEAVLSASYRVVLSTFRRHRRLCRLLFEEAVGLEKGFRERLARHFAVWHERVFETLDHFKAKGAARADLDSEVTAELVLGMVERVTRRYLFRDKAPDLDRLVAALVSLEMRGISP